MLRDIMLEVKVNICSKINSNPVLDPGALDVVILITNRNKGRREVRVEWERRRRRKKKNKKRKKTK